MQEDERFLPWDVRRSAFFERFVLELRNEDVQACSHQGRCDEDVEETLALDYVRSQLDAITDADLAAELREYGAWTPDQLTCRIDNEARIVWIAACNIAEGLYDPEDGDE